MAKSTTSKTSRTKKGSVQMTEDGKYSIYDPAAPRTAYKKGDVVQFPKVRDWLNKGELVEVLGTVVNTGVFDNEVPYIEVSFHAQKKANKIDLGKDIRKFILEVK